MIFDPFGDFETRGYLRNYDGEKDLEAVKILENFSFIDKLDAAFNCLARKTRLSYEDVLETHRILFEAIYPWAGQDRAHTAPQIAVSKGPVLFAHPDDARLAVEHALKIGQDKALMASKPGEVMGYLAYGHPFLDGNGRVIMTVHVQLAQRAGISIQWGATDKTEYLKALTLELSRPGEGHLDAYLSPFVGQALDIRQLSNNLAQVKGLDGTNCPSFFSRNQVLGTVDEPALQSRYKIEKKAWAIGSAGPEIEREG